jgi:hypothetical protein
MALSVLALPQTFQTFSEIHDRVPAGPSFFATMRHSFSGLIRNSWATFFILLLQTQNRMEFQKHRLPLTRILDHLLQSKYGELPWHEKDAK